MFRQTIRNLHSPNQTRFCDVIIDENGVSLEVKNNKNRLDRIPLEDLLYQVNAAKENATIK